MATAAVYAVEITAVLPAPNAGEQEWFELSNTADESVSLLGWQVWDQLSQPSLLLTLSPNLPAHATERFYLEQAQLNNSGDGLTLYNPTGQLIDQFSYTSSQTAVAWVKVNGSWSLDLPVTNSPTPTTALPIPSLQPTPTIAINQLILSRVSACPESGQPEWIELANQSSQTLTLNNWKITDRADQSYQFSLTLAANSQGKVEWSKHFLNNSGETIFLWTDQNQLWLTQELPSCVDGQIWLNQPTANDPSTTPNLSPTSEPSLALSKTKIIPSPPKLPPTNLSTANFAELAAEDPFSPVSGPRQPPTGLILNAIMSFLALATAGGLLWYES